MLYGTPQAGSNTGGAGLNITSLEAGQNLTLLDGTETVVSGSASISFSKGFHDAGQYPITFNISGCSNGSVVEVQVAGADVAAKYLTIATPGITSGNGAYTDSGASPFRRILISTFAAGDVPVVVATR